MRKIMVMLLVILIITGIFAPALSQEVSANPAAVDRATVITPKGPLNLRSAADNNASVLVRIPNGSTVTVLSQGDVYWEIQYADVQGFAMCEFLIPRFRRRGQHSCG